MKKDYYASLGLRKGADEKEIKKAYRKLAKQYHPDTNPGNAQAEMRFKEVTEAYNVLSDQEKRKLYDEFGHAAFDGSMGSDPYKTAEEFRKARNYENYGGFQDTRGYDRGSGWQGQTEFHFTGSNTDDMFRDMFGGEWNFWEGSTKEGYKGGDLESELTISFDEAVLGCDKRIRLQGDGVQSLQVHIPAGIEDGRKIRLQGKGQSVRGGQPGDLYLRIHVREKAGFERKGMDIYTTAAIPYTTAVFGGEVQVKTVYGNVNVRVPAGTQCGSKIRLRGKGVVSMQDSSQYGDEYVTIQIQVPKILSAREKEALMGYAHTVKS